MIRDFKSEHVDSRGILRRKPIVVCRVGIVQVLHWTLEESTNRRVPEREVDYCETGRTTNQVFGTTLEVGKRKKVFGIH